MTIYIVVRYTCLIVREITSAEYTALAELRYLIRKFVGEGDARWRAPRALSRSKYLLLLAIRGLPEGEDATIPGLWRTV